MSVNERFIVRAICARRRKLSLDSGVSPSDMSTAVRQGNFLDGDAGWAYPHGDPRHVASLGNIHFTVDSDPAFSNDSDATAGVGTGL